MTRLGHRRRGSERGAVTAELAMGLPLLLGLTLGLVWLLSVGVAQVRAVDGAREAARALARGDDPAAAVAMGSRVAPAGADIVVTPLGEVVAVEVSAEIQGPGGLFAFLPGVRVHAEAVAAVEPSP